MAKYHYRTCTKCKKKKIENKDNFRFYKTKNIFRSQCRDCERKVSKKYYHEHKEERKEIKRKKDKEYRIKNKEKIFWTKKRYREANKEIIRKKKKKYYNENVEKILKKHQRYYQENKKKRNQKNLEYLHQNIEAKIAHNMRTRINAALRHSNSKKANPTLKLVGCTKIELKEHLESLFQEGMTWENHGYKGWHIDHIVPCASFDLTDPEQQKKCFHYTNLQPLWAKDNLSKGSRNIRK